VQDLIDRIKAVAEPTRLRIVELCAQGELAVSELTDILGQSQPRVSRHLKVLSDAGIIAPMREGNWTFYRLERDPPDIAGPILSLLNRDDPIIAEDKRRLKNVRHRRRTEAEAYFSNHAAGWDAIREMHVDSGPIERQLLAQVPKGAYNVHLDIGTGTGRILNVLSKRVSRSIGVDNSRAMLAIARDQTARAGLNSASLRLADMYALPLADQSADLVTVHLVLHYADTPERAVAEAARVLRPGGRMIIVDFAPHKNEELRRAHAHRRLGFADDEVRQWLDASGLAWRRAEALPGKALTVMVWSADKAVDEATEPLPRIAGSPWI
jgi:ArsR family transcriptional regulator